MDESRETQYMVRTFLQRYESLVVSYVAKYEQSLWVLGAFGAVPSFLLAKARDIITQINFQTPSPFKHQYLNFDMAKALKSLLEKTYCGVTACLEFYRSPDSNPFEIEDLEQIRALCVEGLSRFGDWSPNNPVPINILKPVGTMVTSKLNFNTVKLVSTFIQGSINQQ
jgi:hypothetical protein